MDMSIDRSTCLCIHGPVYLQHGQIYLQPSTYSLQKFQSIGRWTDLWIDLWHRPVYAVGRQVAIDLSTYSLYVQPTACLKIRALVNTLPPPEWWETKRAMISDSSTSQDPKDYGAMFSSLPEDHGTSHISVISPAGLM